MDRFRAFGIMLLIAAILPWGAWTGARVAPLVAAVAAAEAVDTGVSAAVPRAAVDGAARPCRTGVLAGACEVKAVAEAVTEAPVGGGAIVLRPGGAMRAEGLALSPPRDPPRPGLSA